MIISRSRILVWAIGSLLLLAPVEAKTKKPAHKISSSKTAAHKKVRSTRSVRSRGRHAKTGAQKTTWRNRQGAPTSDRYREIQEALHAKGYLKSAPSGAWDSDSQEALRHFQADQNISQTGKVNSLSLIALGLGPSHTPPAGEAAPPQNK